MSSGVIGGSLEGIRSPLIRSSGGMPTLMWRSEAPAPAMCCSSWFRSIGSPLAQQLLELVGVRGLGDGVVQVDDALEVLVLEAGVQRDHPVLGAALQVAVDLVGLALADD